MARSTPQALAELARQLRSNPAALRRGAARCAARYLVEADAQGLATHGVLRACRRTARI
jgi:LDH2 family malate/lactate/ureidoglycolate dehydrogenase